MSNKMNAARRHPAGFVFDVSRYSSSIAMRDLYLECASYLVTEDIRVHALMMPGMPGETFVISAGEDPDFDIAVERTCGVEVRMSDCIAVMYRNFLSTERTEDEMLELVAADVAEHTSAIWSFSDREVGGVLTFLKRATIAAILLMAHPSINILDETKKAVGDRLKARIANALLTEYLPFRSPATFRREQRLALAAVDMIVARAAATNGEYILLPARVADLVDAGRTLLSGVLDDMEIRPISLV